MADNRTLITAMLYDSSDMPIVELTACKDLYLVKERYTPFHSLKISFYCSEYIAANRCARVKLTINDTVVFDGRASGMRCTAYAEGYTVSGRGYSYTRSLLTGDAVPGVFYTAGIDTIAQANTALPKVTYQQISDTVNYIYIKETDSIWDAYTALAIKLYENYPYIHDTNTVFIKKESQGRFTYNDEKITGVFIGEDFKNAISKISMQDIDGNYTYTREDSGVISRGIISERFIPLDRQWLSSPQMGLKHKMYYSKRGSIFRGFSYIGYKGEQICDWVTFSSSGVSFTGEVCKLEVRADKNGIRTTITSYSDGYCPVT